MLGESHIWISAWTACSAFFFALQVLQISPLTVKNQFPQSRSLSKNKTTRVSDFFISDAQLLIRLVIKAKRNMGSGLGERIRSLQQIIHWLIRPWVALLTSRNQSCESLVIRSLEEDFDSMGSVFSWEPFANLAWFQSKTKQRIKQSYGL